MNKLTAEKCREQFEAWWESFYETAPREPWSKLYSTGHDYYVDSEIDGQYDAWKASRNAIEIELPNRKMTAEMGLAISLEKTMARLAVAGIKVKI